MKATLAQNEKGEKVIKVVFDFDLEHLEKIRSIPGRKYYSQGTYWSTPLTIENIEQLQTWKFYIAENLKSFLQISKEKKVEIALNGIPELKGTLRPFQNIAVAFTEDKKGRVLIADEMGLGKTIEALAWIQMHRDKIPIVIICPASLKLNWERETEKWLPEPNTEILYGTKVWKTSGDILILNYDIVFAWIEELKKRKPQILILDECFPAGTKISTPNGLKNIEEIKEGDVVFNATGIGIVQYVNKRITNELIRLHLSDQTFIDVTPNHLFFTYNGWLPASKLINQNLLVDSNILHILHHNIKLKNYEKGNKKMRMVWKRIFFNISTKIWRKAFLRNILLSEMENETTRSKKSDLYPRTSRKSEIEANSIPQKQSRKSKTNLIENEKEQPIFQSKNYGKNQNVLERIWSSFTKTTFKRWEWKTFTKSTENFMGCFGAILENGICHTHKTTTRFGVSYVLQSRHWFAQTQNLDRNRWVDSRIANQTNTKQKERRIFENITVERIEILKSGSGKQSAKCTVYNLQVSSHPSYYAEGFLVHNCHKIKSNKAQRTKVIKRLQKEIPHILGLTGTPIENRPIEIYNILKILMPDLFPNFVAFTLRYCAAHHNGYGMNYNGASNVTELHDILVKTVMIRRKKEDVLKELPEKIMSFVPIAINNRNEYKEAERSFIAYVRQTKGDEAARRIAKIEALAKIEGLKQIAVKGKLEDIINWTKDFFEVNDKLVLFAIHKFVIDELMNEFKEFAVKIDGSVSQIQRQKAVDEFQNNPKVKLIVISEAGGEGITLTAASNIGIVELPWTPGKLSQVIARLHRIGQKDSVTAYFLLAQNTIEEKIAKLLDAKRKTVDAVTDGINTPDESLLSELFKQYEL